MAGGWQFENGGTPYHVPPLSPSPPPLARGYRVSLLFRMFSVGSLPSGQGAHMVSGAVLRPTPDTMRAPTPSAPCVGSRCVLTVCNVLMRGHPAAPLGRLAPRTRALPPTHFAVGFAAGICGGHPRAPFGAHCEVNPESWTQLKGSR